MPLRIAVSRLAWLRKSLGARRRCRSGMLGLESTHRAAKAVSVSGDKNRIYAVQASYSAATRAVSTTAFEGCVAAFGRLSAAVIVGDFVAGA